MATIERRTEGVSHTTGYSEKVLTDQQIARGLHRQWVGGLWDGEYGKTQVDFLISQGLRPEHKVVDIGCGSFRGGRYTIDYLNAGNYYGIDSNQSVVQAGYDLELSDEQRAKLPTSNLLATDRFDVDLGVKFDFALAQSVFSHISLNHVRLCLYRLAKSMEPGGKFFATSFEESRSRDLDYIRLSPKAKQRFSERNVYWYYRGDMHWAASFSPWKVRYIGDWGQPAGQRMIEFTRAAGATTSGSARTAGKVGRFVSRGRNWAARHIATT